ncbi:M24 family metallopeptidase [Salinifilum aidingensis]
MRVDSLAGGAAEHRQRLVALRERMRSEDINAAALTSPENIYYLTGLDHLGYFAFTLLVVPAEGQPVLVTRAMERPTIRAQVPWCRHVTFQDGDTPAGAVVAALGELLGDGGTVALDEDSMFFPPAIAAAIRDGLSGVRWRSGTDLLTAQRAVKSPAELECVRRAASLSDAAMQAGLDAAGAGASERTVAAEVYRTMIDAGGDPPGFPPLIRPTSLLHQEHVSWGDRTLQPGQGLFLELGASVHRYHAPMSRTTYIGHPVEGAAEAAATAHAGLEAAQQALRPGARTGDVYRAWQHAVSDEAGPLRHHCGYLIGIGFPPSWTGGGEVLGIRAGGRTEITPGMTFHLMSWITQPVGHVLSDTALVTATGSELLTTLPRTLAAPS